MRSMPPPPPNTRGRGPRGFLTEEEKNRFHPLHIGALLFTPLEDFMKDEYMSGCFGSTNRKYGVMDYAKVPVEMEECKNEISTIKTNESKV